MRLVRLATILIASCGWLAGSAFAESDHSPKKVDRAVQDSVRDGAQTVKVIITVDDPDLRQQIRRSLEQHGDVIKSEHPLVHAIAAQVHSEDVRQLANYPGVAFVSVDATVRAGGLPSSTDLFSTVSGSDDTGSNSSGQFGNYFANSVSNPLRSALGLSSVAGSGPTGRGIGVALIDSGIAPSYDFSSRITGFFDFTKGGVPAAAYDDYGHGTHVAGLIGSSGVLSGFQFQGVAPAVNFVGLKVLDRNGLGSTSDVIKAIEYVVANRQRLGVQIVNLSLGHPIFARAVDDPLVQAVERASAAGLIVVASAGNFGQNPNTGQAGYAGLTSPANAPSCIAVGAVMTNDTVARTDDRVATYSSRGPTWYDGLAKPDIVAPGHRLMSDAISSSTLFNLLTTSRQKVGVSQFLRLSGTSMAAGVTTGVVALVLEANVNAQYGDPSTLTPNLVRAILEYSATPLTDAGGVPYDVLTQGAGEINAQGAIALGSAIDTSGRDGDSWLRNSVSTQTMFGGASYAWSRNIVWGNHLISGDLLFRGSAAWSSTIIWGDATVVWPDSAIVNPTNIVWADASLWASNVVWGDHVIGLLYGDNIVWGNLFDDNIVWGNLFDDNIVWGNVTTLAGGVF